MPSPNWVAIIIAALIPMIMGFIYYHKADFGKVWMNDVHVPAHQCRWSRTGRSI